MEAVNAIVDFVHRGTRPPQSFVLIGETGAGKRTIIREVARRLHLDFIEVPVSDTADAILQRLIGTRDQVASAEALGAPPGALVSDGPTLLLLSNLERLPARLAQILHEVATRRRYTDPLGRPWPLTDDLWIAASYSDVADPTIPRDHWLIAALGRRFEVGARQAPDTMMIARSIASEFGALLPADPTTEASLVAIARTSQHLHELRRVLESVASVSGTHRISAAELSRGLSRANGWVLARVPYKGTTLSVTVLHRWLSQFPSGLQPVANHLLRQIADSYYIGEREYFTAIDQLTRLTGLRYGSRVRFCQWQDMGDSGPRIAHELKNHAGWRADPDIDLSPQSPRFLDYSRGDVTDVVLADDLVASGGTLLSAIWGPTAPLKEFMRKHSSAQLHLLFIVAYGEPLVQARKELREFGNRVHILSYRLLTERDRCFSASSSILPDLEERQRMEQFCRKAGRYLMRPLRSQFWLGYAHTGSLLVFFDSVPNNSLPLFWYRGPRWTPLFPRSGLPPTD